MTRTVILIALLAVASSAHADRSIHNFDTVLGKPKAVVAKICAESKGAWDKETDACLFPGEPDKAAVTCTFKKGRCDIYMHLYRSALKAEELLAAARKNFGQEDERGIDENGCSVWLWDEITHAIAVMKCSSHAALLVTKTE